MKEGRLLVISGPSGVGKTAVSLKLMEKSDLYVKSISATTRGIRPGEINGVDYFFVTREEFEHMDNTCMLLETTDYNGNRYGTPRQFIEDILAKGKVAILVIDVTGALRVKEMFPDAIICFLNAESLEAIEKRLRNRQTDSEEAILGRLAVARTELDSCCKFDYIVMNCDGEIDEAVDKIDKIITEIMA